MYYICSRPISQLLVQKTHKCVCIHIEVINVKKCTTNIHELFANVSDTFVNGHDKFANVCEVFFAKYHTTYKISPSLLLSFNLPQP